VVVQRPGSEPPKKHALTAEQVIAQSWAGPLERYAVAPYDVECATCVPKPSRKFPPVASCNSHAVAAVTKGLRGKKPLRRPWTTRDPAPACEATAGVEIRRATRLGEQQARESGGLRSTGQVADPAQRPAESSSHRHAWPNSMPRVDNVGGRQPRDAVRKSLAIGPSARRRGGRRIRARRPFGGLPNPATRALSATLRPSVERGNGRHRWRTIST